VVGHVLAEDVISDIDSPPYDKALMDGYAVIASDLRGGRGELIVIDEVAAGDIPCEPLQSGMATRIMTGAPVPRGADAVVVGERCQSDASRRHPDGADRRPRGASRPAHLGPRHVGAPRRDGAASRSAIVGHRRRVVGRSRSDSGTDPSAPSVAVLATGNELVPACDAPGPGQIRNSNGPMLCALVAAREGQPVDGASPATPRPNWRTK
jgi:molybdopterin molybdotransferase